MTLGELREKHRGSARAITRPVKFRILVETESGDEPTPFEADALLRFVGDRERNDALQEAQAALAARYPGQAVLHEVHLAVRAYHVLALVLRDASNSVHPFADSAADLEESLTASEAIRLQAEYQRFVEDEFPERIDEEVRSQLVEEAAKKSLLDLLSEHGLSTIRGLLPFLAQTRGSAPTQT